MKKPSFILRCAAVLLILVFSQKTGAGLFLHNLFHVTNSTSEIPGNKTEKDKELSYACSCIDDFLMPFTETEVSINAESISYSSQLITFFIETVIIQSSVYTPLRGPPANLI